MAAPGTAVPTSQPNPASQAQPQQSQTQAQVDIDPIAKFKQLLLPRLKESLVNLMKVAGQILHQNSIAADGHKPQEGLQQLFEKNLEEFYSLCDQVEVNLRLALEMNHQQSDSSKYTPNPVSIPKSDGQVSDQQSIPYSQYLVTVKQQILCAKEMYDLLVDYVKKLTERQGQ